MRWVLGLIAVVAMLGIIALAQVTDQPFYLLFGLPWAALLVIAITDQPLC